MSDGTLRRVKAQFQVSLHPALSETSLAGVEELLNTLLLRYSEDLGGIVLAYGSTTLASHHGLIQPYFPYTHVDVGATVTLFNPKPGCRLVGVVNKVGRDFIGLLVAGIVNASIGADAIRADLASRPAQSAWVSLCNPRHVISIGTTVVFDVLSVTQTGQFVSLKGALREPDTGAVEVVGYPGQPRKEVAVAEEAHKEENGKSTAKRKRRESAGDAAGEEARENGTKKKKKKEKTKTKKRSKDE